MQNDVIRKNILFQELPEDELEYALRFFSAVRKKHGKGDFLNTIGEPLRAFGLVLDGTVQVYMDDIDGNEMIMANVGVGETFGESLCFLEKETSIYIRAVTDCEILWLSPSKIHETDEKSRLDTVLAARFTSLLANRTLNMNNRIQILSKITLRKKLTAFFSEYVQTYGQEFTVPLSRNDLAVYLGAERSALSRELSKMQKEGIIEFHRNHFRILK